LIQNISEELATFLEIPLVFKHIHAPRAVADARWHIASLHRVLWRIRPDMVGKCATVMIAFQTTPGIAGST
jgi:hypothetical protein